MIHTDSRACLISGPPGIGKSSMVKLLSESLGYETKFINASDNRSKTVIEGLIKDLCESQTLDHFKKRAEVRKTVVVMDEVDGVSGGHSDRGGIPALIRIIKNT